MSQPRSEAEGSVGVKVVTKRLKSGEVKRYKYYQLVKVYRKGGKVRTEYVRYLGKDRPPPKSSSSSSTPCMSQPPHLSMETGEEEDVLANRDPPPPLDLEVIELERESPFSFPRYRATCRRCGERFELIKFELELGHYLCPRCRVEIITEGERWPGYGTPASSASG